MAWLAFSQAGKTAWNENGNAAIGINTDNVAFGNPDFFSHPLIGLCDLFLSNLLSQGFLVYLTKKSASLFPAAVVHAVTNLLPALVAYSDSFYQAHIVSMNCAGLLSAAVVGGISYKLMWKERMFVQGAGKGTERTVHKLWKR